MEAAWYSQYPMVDTEDRELLLELAGVVMSTGAAVEEILEISQRFIKEKLAKQYLVKKPTVITIGTGVREGAPTGQLGRNGSCHQRAEMRDKWLFPWTFGYN